MADKWILIVDDEQPVLTVLKGSLKKLGAEYQVVIASSGETALEELKKRSFDLIVTDYKMAGMNGLELLQAAKRVQPALKMILMTAYGNATIETETRELGAYSYLLKPIEIDYFRQIIRKALADTGTGKPKVFVLSNECFSGVADCLFALQKDVGARCVLLTDVEGSIIARTGDVNDLPLSQIASLIGGGIASMFEVGRIIDGVGDAINLVYREGKDQNVYGLNVGRELLLMLVINHNSNSRIGSVWYYAQQVAVQLKLSLRDAMVEIPPTIFRDGADRAFDNEFDKLLSEGIS